MSEKHAPPQQHPDDVFLFHDNQIPQLSTGTYNLTVSSSLDVDGTGSVSGARTMEFKVAGPQLVLPPDDILAIFPANIARGEFYTVLPHVTIRRASMPWERHSSNVAGDESPWLILLIVSQKEMTDHPITRQVLKVGKDARVLDGFGIKHGEADPEAHVHTATLPAALVATLLPEYKDLKWTGHVRQVMPAATAARPHPEGLPETAILISPILPTPGMQNHAMLISLENRYKGGVKPTGDLTVPVLHEWSFFCEGTHPHGFSELLLQAMDHNGAPASLSVPATQGLPTALADRYAQGYVPVEYHMRRGDLGAAWFRSALSPAKAAAPTATLKNHLPAQHSDGLLAMDDNFAMLDVSYASAWELGRLLMLEQTDIATELYNWKRIHAHATHLAAGNANADPLPSMPTHIETWLKEALLELRSVPFSYLVPEAEMLPPSSLRFFDLDPFWLDCLRDGALSVGRSDSGQHQREMDMRKTLAEPAKMSGFLLRSAAVSDFPHLEVDGYSVDLPNKDDVPRGTDPLKILRFERLSRDVLLVLFEGRVRSVDLHLHP